MAELRCGGCRRKQVAQAHLSQMEIHAAMHGTNGALMGCIPGCADTACRGQLADCAKDIVDRYCVTLFAQEIAAAGSALAPDDTGRTQLAENLLQVGG